MKAMRPRQWLLLLALACTPWLPNAVFAADEAIWTALATGNYVVLMRHEQTVPGIGDPAGFRKDDCSTQRNLSAAGRESARQTGEAFRSRKIPVSAVWSSRWCRCLDTARLAFGRAEPVPMLDSMFNDPDGSDQDKLKNLQQALRKLPSGGNLILITHNANIARLTGISVGSGEMVVASADQRGQLKVIGRLSLQR